MTRLSALTLIAVCGTLPLGASLQAADHTADFPYIYNYDLNNDGASIGLYGRVLAPPGYDSSKSYPLVVFYHGSGEKGTDNTSQVNGNIDGLVAAALSRGFFVYAPQCNASSWYASSMQGSMDTLSQITKDFNIDRSRMYVTGLSMGGTGVWNAISQYTDVFAAAVPISPSNPSAGVTAAAATLPGKPIWIFHAADDTTVNPTDNSRAMINAIRAADGGKAPLTFRLNASPSNPYYNTGAPYYTAASGTTYYEENGLRYTEYASGGHNSWTRAYAQSSMYDWMLSQTSTLGTLQPGKTALFDLGYNQATTTDSQGRMWNSGSYQTETTFGTAISYAADTTGRHTTVEINIVKKFAGNNSVGATGGSTYDTTITGDGWYVGTTAGNASTIANPGILVINGLTPGGLYSLVLFGSHTGNDSGRGLITRYIIGSDYRDLDCADNVDRTAKFDSVAADANGQIQLTLSVAPGATRYGYLNAMEVTALPVPEPASLGLLGLAGLGLLKRRSRR